MTLTYLQFHLVFVVPVLLLLGVAVRRAGRSTLLTPRLRWVGTAVLVVVALVYTTPWDNYLITRGVWWYGEGRVAATVWHAPLEEYLFMALQPVLVALWLALLPASFVSAPARVARRARAAGVGAGLVLGAVGVLLLQYEPTFYLGAIVAWAGPVLALQWGFGWPVLWAVRRPVALAVLVPSAYLWAADRVAIELGIWTISGRYTTGLTLVGLPVEEALFFLVTNLFVVQGLVLFGWVVGRWRAEALEPRSVPLTGPPDGPTARPLPPVEPETGADTRGGSRAPPGEVAVDGGVRVVRWRPPLDEGGVREPVDGPRNSSRRDRPDR